MNEQIPFLKPFSQNLRLYPNPYPYILALLLTLIRPNTVLAQNNVPIKPDLSTDINSWYDSLVGPKNTALHLGVLADMTKKAIGSHPYFEDFRWQEGHVNYRNQEFKHVYLIYNIEEDILITKGDGLSPYDQFIRLNKSQVSSFQINESFFKTYDFGEDNINTGFYEVLFQGEKITFIACHRKLLKINLDSEFEYFEEQEFFIILGDSLYPIKKSSDLTRLFKANRKSIKSFAKENRLKKLSYESYRQYIGIVEYCDELVNQL